jgi:hypothetical protein
MTDNFDKLDRELKRRDPVGPGELDDAAASPAAAELLDRILAREHEEPAAAPAPRARRRLRLPKLVLAPALAGAAAVVIVVLAVSGGGNGNGGGGSAPAGPAEAGAPRVAGALDAVASTAGTQPRNVADHPWSYLKTRELSIDTAARKGHKWSVLQSTTREEWVAFDGSGRMRLVSEPARFIGTTARSEWVAAGKPDFLPLGFERRTENRWLAAGALGRGVEELPADPQALLTHLRYEAESEAGQMPIAAKMLQRIAEDLRDPGATPALRQALFKALKRVPGLENFGESTDPQGRHGIAVGLTATYQGKPCVYSLIFDPVSSTVLASEIKALRSEPSGEPDLFRALVYLQARGIESTSEFGQTWLSGFDEPGEIGAPTASYVVYHVPGAGS